RDRAESTRKGISRCRGVNLPHERPETSSRVFGRGRAAGKVQPRSRSQAARLVALAAPCVALTACWLIAWKLASATSVACLAAFCTLSKALLAAATADFTSATALSVPAGAF